jgi:hypothetical protein
VSGVGCVGVGSRGARSVAGARAAMPKKICTKTLWIQKILPAKNRIRKLAGTTCLADGPHVIIFVAVVTPRELVLADRRFGISI